MKPIQVCHWWKEYCEELYSEQQENVKIDVQERKPTPMKEEIKHAMLKAAQSKAPCPDNMAIELLRFGKEVILSKVHEICTEVWQSGSWPEERTQVSVHTTPEER